MGDDTRLTAKEALRRARDPEHLVHGEASAVPGDAFHWVSVYRELVAFKQGLLAQADFDADGLSPTAMTEIVVDIGLLCQQNERYEERLRYWRSMVPVTGRVA
jgi:hypothetical protein